jgi:hypothetical protein
MTAMQTPQRARERGGGGGGHALRKECLAAARAWCLRGMTRERERQGKGVSRSRGGTGREEWVECVVATGSTCLLDRCS